MKTMPIILCPAALMRANGVERLYVNRAYADALHPHGVSLLAITSRDQNFTTCLFETASGLLLQGGVDVDPCCYGEKAGLANDTDHERDLFELAILKEALARQLPVLAICRGMQLLNVLRGGTLLRDIRSDMKSDLHDRFNQAPRSFLAHEVTFEKDTLIHSILGVNSAKVNSLHHQGIKRLGQQLTVAGRAPDGLAEAVELTNYPFLVAVQWHPEELTKYPLWRKFFEAFAEVAKKRRL